MTHGLEVESKELATAFGVASPVTQRQVAAQMVERALAAQQPPLEVPDDPAGLHALADDWS